MILGLFVLLFSLMFLVGVGAEVSVDEVGSIGDRVCAGDTQISGMVSCGVA